jgi:hypothetical protein
MDTNKASPNQSDEHRSSVATSLQQITKSVPCPKSTLPARRRFLGTATKIVMGLTSIVGGAVGFAPSAVAQEVPCLTGTRGTVPNNRCVTSCVGLCDSYTSVCFYNDPNRCALCYAECLCPTGCVRARVTVVCNPTSGQSYYCCVACTS